MHDDRIIPRSQTPPEPKQISDGSCRSVLLKIPGSKSRSSFSFSDLSRLEPLSIFSFLGPAVDQVRRDQTSPPARRQEEMAITGNTAVLGHAPRREAEHIYKPGREFGRLFAINCEMV